MDDPSPARLAKLERMLLRDLAWALSNTTGVLPDQIRRGHSFPELCGLFPSFSQELMRRSRTYRRYMVRQLNDHPQFESWLRALSRVVVKYTVIDLGEELKQQQEQGTASGGNGGGGGNSSSGGEGKLRMVCPESAVSELVGGGVVPLPGVDCANESSVLAATGLFPVATLPLEVVAQRVISKTGWCAVHPLYNPYGTWLVKERLLRRARRSRAPAASGPDPRSSPQTSMSSSPSDNPHKERVADLFGLLYESYRSAKKQRWMGSVVSQNPFDMFAIMDIIHILAPDLIIETGTGGQGNALMWTSMLNLAHGSGAKVIVVGAQELAADTWAAMNADDPSDDPTNNPLWGKHVTYIKGSPLDNLVVDRIGRAASKAKTVLALLGSDVGNVTQMAAEIRSYCPMVTNGSYCIVQGTRPSRLSPSGGAAAAVEGFLADPSGEDFIAHRAGEPFHSQHAGGYLLRVKPGNSTGGDINNTAGAAGRGGT